MLEQIYIKNVALIDEAFVEFGRGLNVLSGETGAGKSMIFDSVNFALGDRSNKDIIRTNEDNAKVDLLFYISDETVAKKIEEQGFNIDDDKSLLISRTINSNGKTSCKINGQPATVAMLKKVTEILIDIHGQHAHQSLLNSSKHIVLLDTFCGQKIVDLKNELLNLYNEYKNVTKSIEKLASLSKDKDRRISMLEFEIEDIEQAELKVGEEELLNNQKKAAQAADTILSSLNYCIEYLYDSQNDNSAYDNINKAAEFLDTAAEHQDKLNGLYERLMSISVEAEDIAREIRVSIDNLEDNVANIDEIEDRLNTIYNLKRKYGKTISDILLHLDKSKKEIESLKNSIYTVEKLSQKKNHLTSKIEKLCAQISEIRKKEALKITDEIESVLKELGMQKAVFSISFDKKTAFSPDGIDKVEFMLSANVGEELKPLAKIASGGEMSRVMLALKTALANSDNIETFIFDEIDTGVSGRTAQKVAEKMALIGKTIQIICISHLPQIASMADNHFLIEKTEEDNKTKTKIKLLDKEMEVLELARLLGGAKITDSTIEAAREMKHMANDIKSNS